MTRLSILVGDGPGSVERRAAHDDARAVGRRDRRRRHRRVVSAASYPTARAAARGRRRRPRRRRRAGVATSPPRAAPPIPTVYVDLSFDGSHGRALDGRVVFGRGIDTYVWAATHVAAWVRWPPVTVRYGDRARSVRRAAHARRRRPAPGGRPRARRVLEGALGARPDGRPGDRSGRRRLGVVEHRVPPRRGLLAPTPSTTSPRPSITSP